MVGGRQPGVYWAQHTLLDLAHCVSGLACGVATQVVEFTPHFHRSGECEECTCILPKGHFIKKSLIMHIARYLKEDDQIDLGLMNKRWFYYMVPTIKRTEFVFPEPSPNACRSQLPNAHGRPIFHDCCKMKFSSANRRCAL